VHLGVELGDQDLEDTGLQDLKKVMAKHIKTKLLFMKREVFKNLLMDQ
jgi:hypothetical protein